MRDASKLKLIRGVRPTYASVIVTRQAIRRLPNGYWTPVGNPQR